VVAPVGAVSLSIHAAATGKLDQSASSAQVSVTLPQLLVEFPQISPYDDYADAFVRLNRRDRTGWRRDELAHSPLFIWRKKPVLGPFCRG